ncbi:DUF636 domain protein [Truncatella angustata]|uniref:DUF636 domain protein n=1 Tax=Truncatella angustata TaxID=152316 RepID=A0A9P8UJF6_9PEZI|nr:DUF636 domain protein [Truncatella angustata]KAH6653211.1 DUF636 domain protein [Truncatella angustata]
MSSTRGSCLCGAIQFEFTGQPEATALCHCKDCQKWTGSAYTSNAVVPRKSFRVVKGEPKWYDATGASGKINKHFFCGTCGSSLYTELEIMPDVTCVKGGSLDGGAASLGGEIGAEFYVGSRVGYLPEIRGAKQEPALG